MARSKDYSSSDSSSDSEEDSSSSRKKEKKYSSSESESDSSSSESDSDSSSSDDDSDEEEEKDDLIEYEKIFSDHFGIEIKKREDIWNTYFKEEKDKYEKQINKFVNKENQFTSEKCYHCGSTNTYVEEKQTRSGDEPLTEKIHCSDCGKVSFPK